MSIYISNNLYLTGGLGPDFNANNPIIGYHSVLLPEHFIAETDPENLANVPLNMWSPDTASRWEGESFASSFPFSETYYVTLINISNVPVNYLGIAKHNFGSVGFTYTLESSSDDGDTWDVVSGPRIIGKDNAIVEYFDDNTSGLFRIKLEKTAVQSGSFYFVDGPIISHIKLGRALVLQRRIYVGHQPATLCKMVKRITNGSENGQYLGQEIVRSYHQTSVTQQNNTPAFVRTYVKPFIDHVNGHVEIEDTAPATFFFAWRPGDYPEEVVYGWTEDNIRPENQGSDSMGGRMSWSFDMEAVA